MIPERFVVEYPQRCLQLLLSVEPVARERKLIGSFSLLLAAAIFTIPYARLKLNHPLALPAREGELYEALRGVERNQKFLEAEFWQGVRPASWHFSRIMSRLTPTEGWRGRDGIHPPSSEAENTMHKRKAGEVLRVIRNALAHGNVVYLDRDGYEKRGAEVQYLAFLSAYEEPPAPPQTYRLAATTEDGFLAFVRSWATWLGGFEADERFEFGSIES